MAASKGSGKRARTSRSGDGEKTAGRKSRAPHQAAGGADARRFPVVAVGASAGGLGALSEFFGAVPRDSGMAYVVIQHLAPGRPSSMPELLGHRAEIEIVAAEDGQPLQPDHVYVLPPGCLLSISEGKLHVADMPDSHPMPVDYFLRSLAADQGERGFAVILSGTGTDGTLGVREIKAADGVVAVQSPETAEYAGMPNSAMATGQADFVLPAAEIPNAFATYVQQVLGTSSAPAPPQPKEWHRTLPTVFALLRERTGHDFAGYKTSTILRRVARRMAVHRTDDYAIYLRLLREDPAELDRLFKELIIPVTGFFRDPDAFAAVAEGVLPRLLAQRGAGDTLRVWVPGCSSGEEAYSIAILVAEALDGLKQRLSVQIFATDIDTAALEKARKGRYPASIALEVDRARLHRFFTRDGDFYQVTKSLRDMLVFAEQDVIKDPPFSRVDLISCRNVLIYLGADLQRRLLPVFHYALKPGGYLFLGTAETVGNMDDLFAVEDSRWKIYARRNGETARHAYHGLPQFTLHGREAYASGGGVSESPPVNFGDLVHRVLLDNHVPAAVLVDGSSRLLYVHGSTGAFLQPAAGDPTHDLLPMVRPGLEGLVRGVIHRVRRSDEHSAGGVTRIQVAGQVRQVRVTAHRVDDAGAPPGSVLLLLEELGTPTEQGFEDTVVDGAAESGERVAELERELSETREELQATIEELETANEELQSSNEELQSSNEELQSSNEELETSREELQSVNDELRSVNAELESKVEEATRAKQDMDMLLASTEIGIVFVDNTLRIERFTPAVRSIIPMLDSDIGRPIDDLSHKLQHAELKLELEEVVNTLSQRQHKVEGKDGHTYMIRMRPYRSAAGRVIGAVMVFVDITEEARLAFLGRLRDALGQCEDMVLLVDLTGGIEYVNEAFCEATGYRQDEVVGQVTDALAAPGLTDEDRRQMDSNLRRGRTWRGDFRFRCRDGGAVTASAFFAPIRNPDGQVTHAVAYLQPVDAQA